MGLTVDPSVEVPGLREWFDALGPGSGKAAAFDTRVDAPELLTGHASKGIGKRLSQRGYELVAEPESFLVSGDSDLRPGELDRARKWGEMLAAALNDEHPQLISDRQELISDRQGQRGGKRWRTP